MIALGALNWIEIIGAAVASFVVGMLWYSPSLFGKQWMKMMKMSEKDMKGGDMMKTMVPGFIAGIVNAFILSVVLGWAGVTNMVDAVFVAFLVWIGFIATITYNGVLYEKKGMDWYYITAGYLLASQIVMAIVIVML